MEELGGAVEGELYGTLRAGNPPDPELLRRVRTLRAESNQLFRAFVEEADRTAAALGWRASS